MEGTIGEVRLFAGNFAPRSWAFCEGQLLAISSNTALFSILGTTYGGDGRTTFALPDLRGRVPLGPGNGPGLTSYREGQKGGAETVTLNVTQMPSHNHATTNQNLSITLVGNSANGSTADPGGKYLARSVKDEGRGNFEDIFTYSETQDNTPISGATISGQVTTLNNGGNQSHTNMQPFLAIYYIICLQGIFPSRS